MPFVIMKDMIPSLKTQSRYEEKATIYDRRNSVIFDPSDYTNGVYKFTAIVDHTIDDIYQTPHDNHYVYPINSGYCDVWEITKLS